ncbi:MAG: ThiF family adenylyltransferase [Candidatus Saccharimonadales bacterium]
MRNFRSEEQYRNYGFWNNPTQEGINETHISIAGTGGAGHEFGVKAARMGVQYFSVADPEVFERANSNRIIGVNEDTINRNKAVVMKEDILAINPDAQVTVYEDGVTTDNIDEFLHPAHIVLNATELSMPHLGAMVCRESRQRIVNGEHSPLPVLDIEYIAHAGQVTAFDPHSRMTFERLMGIKGGDNAPYNEIAEQSIDPSRYLAYLPPYGDIRTLEAIRDGAPLPSNVIGAGVAAQLGLAELLKHIRARSGERGLRPTFAPHVRWADVYTGKSGTTGLPMASYYRHLAGVAVRNLAKRHEPASYTPEARAARGDLD